MSSIFMIADVGKRMCKNFIRALQVLPDHKRGKQTKHNHQRMYVFTYL